MSEAKPAVFVRVEGVLTGREAHRRTWRPTQQAYGNACSASGT